MRVKPRKNRSEKLISLAPNSSRKSATFCIITATNALVTLFFLYCEQIFCPYSPNTIDLIAVAHFSGSS